MEAELEVPEGEALSLVSTPTRIGNTTCRPHNRRQPGSEKKSRVRARLEPGKMRVGYPHEGGVAQSSLSELQQTSASHRGGRIEGTEGGRDGGKDGGKDGGWNGGEGLTHGGACRRARVERVSPTARPRGPERPEERSPQRRQPQPRAPPGRRGHLGWEG